MALSVITSTLGCRSVVNTTNKAGAGFSPNARPSLFVDQTPNALHLKSLIVVAHDLNVAGGLMRGRRAEDRTAQSDALTEYV